MPSLTGQKIYNKFRTTLKQAWREKLITEELHDIYPGLREREAEVEFFTIDDFNQLLRTRISDDLHKRAILLSVLKGLRFCDI